jgi:DNA-binding transcriptional regulator YiaG
MNKVEFYGQALYGPRWQSELARALGVSDRTVRRWSASGELPDAYWPAVRGLIDEQIKLLRSLR